MSTELRLGPELASVLERSRRRARDLGELQRARFTPVDVALSAEAREVIVRWLRDGGYDAAVADIGEQDPDLANE